MFEKAWRQFEHGDGLLAGDAGEPFEEIVERFPSRKVIEKILQRNPGAGKAWFPTQSVRMDGDNSLATTPVEARKPKKEWLNNQKNRWLE